MTEMKRFEFSKHETGFLKERTKVMDHSILPYAKRVLICCHIHPDADGLSCCAASHNLYRDRGAVATVFTCGDIPERLEFILQDVRTGDDPDRFNPDLIIILDTCIDKFYTRRIGLDVNRFAAQGKRVLCIDHHPIPSEKTLDLGKLCFEDIERLVEESRFVALSDSEQVSCASVLVKYFNITDPILYNGIRDDSGNFSRKTLSAMAAVKRLNIDDETIATYHQKSKPKPKSPEILEHIKKNGIIRIGEGTRSFRLLGIQEESQEIAKSVLGILRQFYPDVGVVWGNGISLRSENFDVRSIATEFGGGGHPGAAGSSGVSVREMPFIGETISKHLEGLGTGRPLKSGPH